jgi:hypothetical protein
MKSEMSELTRRLAKVVLPLRQKEQLEAIKAAKAHIAKDLSDHYRVLGAELRIDKPPDPKDTPLRMIGVMIIDYGNRRNYEVLVTGSGKVVRVVDLRGAQPPYTREEIEEARKIGEQDPRVARVAKRKGSFVSEFAPERAADNARRIGLRYAVVEKGRASGVVARGVVDLSARKLVEFAETSVAEPNLGRK